MLQERKIRQKLISSGINSPALKDWFKWVQYIQYMSSICPVYPVYVQYIQYMSSISSICQKLISSGINSPDLKDDIEINSRLHQGTGPQFEISIITDW